MDPKTEEVAAVLAAFEPEGLEWQAHNCHVASKRLVEAASTAGNPLASLPGWDVARVARGSCAGVGGQHSWVALGDPYDPRTRIVDPTLWSYDPTVTGVWYGTGVDGRHVPHGGHGSIWTWGRPKNCDPAEAIALEPGFELSETARWFISELGPLDALGWMLLGNAPVAGWPAGEVYAAIVNTPALGIGLLPIDKVGMLTDMNPDGLYFPGPEKSGVAKPLASW